ncbi:MAG: hypothetical protein ABFQ53_01075, partial [Patescibacteria group bacterium]
ESQYKRKFSSEVKNTEVRIWDEFLDCVDEIKEVFDEKSWADLERENEGFVKGFLKSVIESAIAWYDAFVIFFKFIGSAYRIWRDSSLSGRVYKKTISVLSPAFCAYYFVLNRVKDLIIR